MTEKCFNCIYYEDCKDNGDEDCEEAEVVYGGHKRGQSYRIVRRQTMKRIIDISEEIYMAICDNGYIFDEDSEDIAKAIKNSTSVSNEGDLISREALKKAIASLVVNGESRIYEVMPRCGGEWVDGIASAYREIDNAPTVVCEEREQGKCPYYAG